ncbi:hypothetical protein D0Z03_002489 [Geotrichum reessii]|nr:hypothetical protein D0Z03_002489 [Galactomyces reessii]
MEADKHFINVNDSDNQSRIVPAFGVHPWYSYKYYIPSSSPSEGSMDAPLTGAAKAAHYAAVLAPAPDAAFVAALPDPVSFVPVLHQIEAWLVQWPDAIMGECGLDKIFRVPNPFYVDVNDTTPEQHEQQPKFSKYTVRIAHQTAFLRLQLELAARYSRPVSLHCVKAPTALLDLVHTMALAEGIAPPALCLHSYTGSVEYLVNNWYTTTKPAKKQQQQNQKLETDSCNYINPATMPLSASLPRVYVSLSEFFNNDARHQSVFAELVRAVPPDRLLLESDHYVAEGDWAAMNEAVSASVAAALGVPVAVVVNRARQNFNEFCRVASV